MRNSLLMLITFLLASTAAIAQVRSGKDESWSELLPPGQGRDMVRDSCVGCHDLKVVVVARKSRADWDKTINDMIERGTPIFPEEIEPMSVYLSKAFGSVVPAPLNVNTAKREELEKVPDLNQEVVTRIIELRGKSGPFKNAAELRQALGMEKENFEKIGYLLKYSD